MALAGLFLFAISPPGFRMIWRCLLLIALVGCALLPSAVVCQERALSVSATPEGLARIALPSGGIVTVPKERGQVGINEGRTAPDGRTVGWMVQYSAGDVAYPISGTLVVWRAGKVMHRFPADQAFYSWAFYAGGRQVAFHVGPLHGELKSHCELHDVESGRLVAVWDGNLDAGNDRPAWTKGLYH
jgi:hypothetical protein